LPGRKQVYRFKEGAGRFKKDVIALADERAEGEPLLVKVMENGNLSYNLPSLEKIRTAASKNLSALPEEYKTLINAPIYPVELSQDLQKLIETTKFQITKNEVNNGAKKVLG
jgi:nicotinate phosphoribosyltransferase